MLQLTWTFLVLGGQIWQISRQLTTFELSNLGRYGYMGGRGQSLATQQGHVSHRHAHTPSQAETEASPEPAGHRHAHAHGHNHPHGVGAICKACVSKALPGALLSIVGLDLYTKGKAADGMARARQNAGANPFDLGLYRNCTDFWTRGRTLGVDYTQLFDVPDGGFKSVIRSRAAQGKSKAGLDAGARGQYQMLSSGGQSSDV